MDYKIEKNIPLAGKGLTELTPEFNAILKLETGDSFEFPKARRNRVVSAITKQKNIGPHKKFTIRNSSELFGRVWRVK